MFIRAHTVFAWIIQKETFIAFHKVFMRYTLVLIPRKLKLAMACVSFDPALIVSEAWIENSSDVGKCSCSRNMRVIVQMHVLYILSE